MSELRKLLRDLIRAVSEKDFDQFVDGKSDFTKITEIATQIIKSSENNEKIVSAIIQKITSDLTRISGNGFYNKTKLIGFENKFKLLQFKFSEDDNELRPWNVNWVFLSIQDLYSIPELASLLQVKLPGAK